MLCEILHQGGLTIFGKKVWYVNFKIPGVGFGDGTFVFRTPQQVANHLRETYPDVEIYIIAQVRDNWT